VALSLAFRLREGRLPLATAATRPKARVFGLSSGIKQKCFIQAIIWSVKTAFKLI